MAGDVDLGPQGTVGAGSSPPIRIALRARRELIVVLALDAVGLGLLAVGWVGASESIVVHKQMPWLNLAVAGLAVATFANARWVLRGRWDLIAEFTKLAALLAPQASSEETTAQDFLATELVSAPGMRLYHRADCRFAAKKPVQSERRAAHEAAGRVACQVCRP